MKKVIFSALMICSLSAISVAQDVVLETIEATVIGKVRVSDTEHIYKLKSNNGIEFESLPTQAQKAIGEHATATHFVEISGLDVIIDQTGRKEGGSTDNITKTVISGAIPGFNGSSVTIQK